MPDTAFLSGHIRSSSQLSLALVTALLLVLSDSVGRREFAFAGVVLGILPAVQTQVFLCALIYRFVWFGLWFALEGKKSKLGDFIQFGIFFGAVAVLPLIHYIPRRNRTSMIIREDFCRGLRDSGVFFAPVAVWWDALGLFFVVVIIFPFWLGDVQLIKFYLPGLVVFAFLNRYRLQPYYRQNVLGFYPLWMIPGCIVFFSTIRKLEEKFKSEEVKGLVIGLGALVYVLSIASGLLGVRNLHDKRFEAWTPDMEALAKWIAGNTPKNAVFITSSQPFDPVVQLAGKVSFYHAPRVVWSCGFVIAEPQREIRELIEDAGSTTHLRQVQYAVNWANKSTDRHLVRRGNGNWSKVYNTDTFVVFQRHL
jgi:hypothetical protein